MQSTDDSALLRDYAQTNSEGAFAALVTKHVNLVYSVAMRSVGNAASAEEITQAVFIILARKAGQLRNDKALSSWLFQTTRLTANNFLRTEMRRQRREQEAHDMQTILNEPEPDIWPKIAPLLDAAVANLKDKDRRAILLRYYEGKNLSEIGTALGASEAAAEKRVLRAVEKLQKFFFKRGVASTAQAITETISANSIQAAPVALIKTTTAVALAKGATASLSTSTLIKGALKLMAWSKAKTAIIAGTGALFLIGTTAITMKTINAHKAYRDSWLTPNLDSATVEQSFPQVQILPTRFPNNQNLYENGEATKWGGLNVPVYVIAWVAYQWSPARIVFTTPQPRGKYDFIASLPQGSYPALQHELKKQFGLVGRFETRDTDCLVLKVQTPNAPGLKPPNIGGDSDWNGPGQYVCDDRPISTDAPPFVGLQRFLEQYFNRPVVDETGLTNHFSIDLKWNEMGRRDRGNQLKQALLNQLGLELVPARRSVEMLVMEKAK